MKKYKPKKPRRRIKKNSNFKKNFRAARKIILWIWKRKPLAWTIIFFTAFLFIGTCSRKGDYKNRTAAEVIYLDALRGKYSNSARVLDIFEVARISQEACDFIVAAENKSKDVNSFDAVDLLIGTAIIESDLRPRFQDVGGDAIGLYQVEYGTFKDLWQRAIPYKYPRLYKEIRKKFGDAKTGEIYFGDLQTSDVLCAIFARVKYMEVSDKIPDWNDIDAQANYYKKFYNTENGASTIDRYKKKKNAVIDKIK